MKKDRTKNEAKWSVNERYQKKKSSPSKHGLSTNLSEEKISTSFSKPKLPPSRGTLGIRDTAAIKRIENELTSKAKTYEKILSAYDENFEGLQFEKKVPYLKGENKQIREELKRFSELINDFVATHKQGIRIL